MHPKVIAMKKLFLLLFLASALCFQLQAQCNINTSILTSPGVYPSADSIPCIAPGQYYDVTLQGLIDTAYDGTTIVLGQTVPVHATIDSIRFDSIVGLPSGIFWSQNPLVLKGGEHGCIQFTGVTQDAPGIYPLTVYGTVWAYIHMSAFGFIIDSPVVYTNMVLNDYSPFGGYYLTVCNYSVELGNNESACANSLITLNPVVTGGVAPYTYIWSGTGNSLSCTSCKNPTVTLTQNSTYAVTVIDAANNQTNDNISYSLTGGSNTMQVTSTNTGIDCLNPQNTTTATVSGGTANYTFNWGDGTSVTGAAQQQHVYTQSGNFVISVKDASGCIASKIDTVEYNGILVTKTNQVQPNCINQNTGKLVATATNGTAPYSFLWSNGSTVDSATNITAGNYSVTVTDATSCSAVANYNLAPANGWGYYVYLNPSVTNCSNNGTVVATVNGGSPPFGFNWSTGQTTQNIGSLAGGVYYLSVYDALGCEAKGHATVPVNCYSIISGRVFNDANSNCTLDGGEAAITNTVVYATGNGNTYYGYTSVNGTYSIQVPAAGAYTLHTYDYYFGSCGSLSLCNNPNQIVTISTLGDTSSNNNFVDATGGGFNLDLFVTWSAGNPGFNKHYRIYPVNVSSVPFNGTAAVTFTYDPNLIYQSSNLPVTHNLAAHTLTWQVDSIDYGYVGLWASNEILATFLVPVGLSLSTIVQADFVIEPKAGDCDSSNNHIHTSDLVTGSFDPNEKKVEPAGKILEEDSILTYTIGFQNTGTDSTHFIILKDTLSPNLEAATVRNIASSHAYSEFNISGAGILTWTFNPLRLVDSFTNEPGSHGFVKFTVKKKSNMPVGSIISNKAYIYFDYNEPVITNTVADTIYEPNSIFSFRTTTDVIVKAYPNPFCNATQIEVEGLNKKFDFDLYDVSGKLRREIKSVENNRLLLQRDNLPAGIYFFRITSPETGETGYGKLVIE